MPFLVWSLVGLIFISLWYYKPWANNWEPLRVKFLGEEPTRSVSGDWAVTKVVATGSDRQGLLVPKDTDVASFSFSPSGRVLIKLDRGASHVSAHGGYSVRGHKLTITGVKAVQGSYPTRAMVPVKVTVAGTDELLMKVGDSQVLYLRRVAAGAKPEPILLRDTSQRRMRGSR